MIADVLRAVCGTHNIDAMNDQKCHFRTLPQSTFHALTYGERRHDDPEARQAIFDLIEDSYGIHLWNYLYKNVKFNLRNEGAMATITKNSCPSIHSISESI